jgi:hypothetical protein
MSRRSSQPTCFEFTSNLGSLPAPWSIRNYRRCPDEAFPAVAAGSKSPRVCRFEVFLPNNQVHTRQRAVRRDRRSSLKRQCFFSVTTAATTRRRNFGENRLRSDCYCFGPPMSGIDSNRTTQDSGEVPTQRPGGGVSDPRPRTPWSVRDSQGMFMEGRPLLRENGRPSRLGAAGSQVTNSVFSVLRVAA